MNHKRSLVCMAALLLAGIAGKTTASETASATISGSPVGGGVTQYNISLTNTSTDGSTVGTFWFSWVPGSDFMEAKPTGIVSPTGWNAAITGSDNSSDGNAIQWVASSNLLAQGGTDNFFFDSTESLSQLLGPSSYGSKPSELTSFAYHATPFSDTPGFEFQVQAEAVPEPASMCLIALGSGALLFRRRRA